MLTPQQSAAQHTDMLSNAGTWGPTREYARNTAKASQRIALQGVHTPTAWPLGPLLVRTRSDAEPRKGDAGNPTSHTPTDPPAPLATLRKATSHRGLHT